LREKEREEGEWGRELTIITLILNMCYYYNNYACVRACVCVY